jgi:hypothetical protein
MRIFLSTVVLGAAVGVLAGFIGCGADPEPVHSACRSFCEALVAAMDDSDM